LVDPEAVRARLHHIDSRLDALRPIVAEGRERFLHDPRLQAEAERYLQTAIQAAIDVGNHILAEDFPEAPGSYREVFQLLSKRGVIDADLAERLSGAAGLRNILVHLYLDVDPERLWAQLKQLDDLKAFAEVIEGYLAEA
jgi:uncharacterized protein YutE (UPF0331/DUF86 family)